MTSKHVLIHREYGTMYLLMNIHTGSEKLKNNFCKDKVVKQKFIDATCASNDDLKTVGSGMQA